MKMDMVVELVGSLPAWCPFAALSIFELSGVSVAFRVPRLMDFRCW
jgi:hypothetical protein